MTLGEQQERFMEALPFLILKAMALGYKVRGGQLRRCNDCKVGLENSTHKNSLAIDLHLFKDGEYLQDGTGHHELHDYWENLGGAKRIDADLNHYSFEWEGVR